MSVPEPLADGTLVADRYRVLAVVGSGGWGRVYRVADVALDRVVALKTLRLADPEAVSRFRREVRLASRVTHPNVIRLFDLGLWGTTSFLTMEYVAGPSLRTRLAAGPLPVGEAAGIARQIALGLGAAHACGIVHRDLKPENVLLEEGGRVVVADFGVAGEPAGNDPASAIVGTSAYMSPEQANGEGATPQADLYTLGLVLHEMLTGQVPLVGNGPVATALRREREIAPRLRDLRPDAPEGLEALAAHLLQREPSARPREAREVVEALAPWATPVTSVSGPALLEERPTGPRWKGTQARRRGRLVAAGAVGLAVAGLLAAWPWLRRAAPDPRRATIFRLAAHADVELPAALGFLSRAIPGAAYRALAARLPGRVGLPGSGDLGAALVEVRLRAEGGVYLATLRTGRSAGRGRATAPVAALDQAAEQLVASALPRGPAPGPRDDADRRAWGAPDQAALLALRRAEVACARVRGAEVEALLRGIERPGFARPLVAHIFMVAELDADLAELGRLARSHGAAAPPQERALLEAATGLLETDVRRPPALGPPPEGDVWAHVVRAWTLAMTGKTDEAFAVAEGLARDPERGGIGLYLANRLAHYYDRGRRVRTAEALTEALPEEPGPWIDLAAVREWADDLPGAGLALARARALGASDDDLADVEGQIAIARSDVEGALRHGRRLLQSPSANRRLAGQVTLYAADVLRGAFGQAAERAPALTQALRAASKLVAVEEARSLATDAFARGDHQLSRSLLELALEQASTWDHDYVASARLRLAALDRIEGRLTEAQYQARQRATLAELRSYGLGQTDDEWLGTPRLMLALRAGDCGRVLAAARPALERGEPLAVTAVAACEIDAERPAAALARLESMFRRYSRRLLPTLVVRRELLLGRALHAMGRRAEARPHLERALALWSQVVDGPEVSEARRLLAED